MKQMRMEDLTCVFVGFDNVVFHDSMGVLVYSPQITLFDLRSIKFAALMCRCCITCFPISIGILMVVEQTATRLLLA